MIFFFFFNDTATTEIYTLSLHDALPISFGPRESCGLGTRSQELVPPRGVEPPESLNPSLLIVPAMRRMRSEEHTSELQSPCNLVCRLLLEKKKVVFTQSAVTTPQSLAYI